VTFGVPLGVRLRNRKLHNILPSGAFSPEVTLWNVTRSDPEGGFIEWDASMRNRKLRKGDNRKYFPLDGASQKHVL
jgi:hypothetical protein